MDSSKPKGELTPLEELEKAYEMQAQIERAIADESLDGEYRELLRKKMDALYDAADAYLAEFEYEILTERRERAFAQALQLISYADEAKGSGDFDEAIELAERAGAILDLVRMLDCDISIILDRMDPDE